MGRRPATNFIKRQSIQWFGHIKKNHENYLIN